MKNKIQKSIKKAENRSYTAKDFESYRSQLLGIARTYFPDKIQDFSEPSVGGMFLDFVSTVGDSLSYYLDHSFRELDYARAVEPENIITHLRNSGVDIVGSSPASTDITFQITVPAELVNGSYVPKRSSLPTILAGTQLSSFSGIVFTTVDDLDFGIQDTSGQYVADFEVLTTNTLGAPETFKMTRKVTVVSGEERTELFDVPDTFVPFREYTLAEKNISTIVSITDSDNNEYYEVDSLSEDTVFLKVPNIQSDLDEVSYHMEIVPAPYRFIKRYDPVSQLTTVRFGSGNADTLDNDIIADPSNLSLSLFGKTTVTRFGIDPSSLLQSKTLGVSPRNTLLTMKYRHGGGLDHNVAPNTIQQIDSLSLSFRRNPTAADALSVRQSVSVTNLEKAAGGDSAPSLNELKLRIPAARKAQKRVVTKEDLLSRVYTLPSEFGRVARAAVVKNPVNPQSSILYVISKDAQGKYSVTPDSLKRNISTYLNDFRLVGDALDILDAKVINFGIKYEVITAPGSNKQQIIQTVNGRLSEEFSRRFYEINQPIIVDDITNVIINTDDVISLKALRVFPITGIIDDREYSNSSFDFSETKKSGSILPDPGGIFELRFPEEDIIGTAF